MTAAFPLPSSDIPTISPTVAGFPDLHPAFTAVQAMAESSRCLYCYDAPCVRACPTSIDIPGFVRRIATGNAVGAGKTILASNILGGTCARVCPTEELCEEACVKTTSEHRPVSIGRLQRHATDAVFAKGVQPFTRAAATGKSVAVIGAGPAGLSAAHGLAREGHAVTIYDARAKAGGLNEYGLAPYKMTDDFAAREIDFVLSIGGITIETGRALGSTISLDSLLASHDAVFLGVGLGDTNGLGIAGEDLTGVRDAVAFIEDVRQADDLAALAVPKKVIVLGGGNTAVDAAIQAARLNAGPGAEVVLAYRRGPEHMGATGFEQDLARANGVILRFFAAPLKIVDDGAGHVSGVEFERTEIDANGRAIGTGETTIIAADLVLKAIGQKLKAADLAGITLEKGRVVVGEDFQTSRARVFAGGDCIARGADLTVRAVEDGKRAARAIHSLLSA